MSTLHGATRLNVFLLIFRAMMHITVPISNIILMERIKIYVLDYVFFLNEVVTYYGMYLNYLWNMNMNMNMK